MHIKHEISGLNVRNLRVLHTVANYISSVAGSLCLYMFSYDPGGGADNTFTRTVGIILFRSCAGSR